ncbi:hypothetical protein [Calothrix rhizosoleniae]
MRVAGYNPVVIERVKTASSLNILINKFPVTEAQYQEVMGVDDSIKTALDKFKENLQEIETKITLRNQIYYTYEYLLSFRIPQSINI